MSFYFPLSSVLRVREADEQREERVLMEINSEIEVANQSLEEVTSKLAETESARPDSSVIPQPGYHVQAWYGEIQTLSENRKQLLDRIEKLKNLRSRQMLVFRNARRHREVLDTIRDASFADFEADADRREQRTMDDQHAAQRFRKYTSS